MKDLVRLVRLGKQDPDTFGLNTRMRTAVAEVISTPPAELCSMIGTLLLRIGDIMCERGLNFVIQGLDKREDLDAGMKEVFIAESKTEWSNFALQLRRNIEKHLPRLEALLFDHIFTLNPELFVAGYIRLPHQQELDCTDLEGARRVKDAVSAKEAELEVSLKKIAALDLKLASLKKANQELASLNHWISKVLELTGDRAVNLSEAAAMLREKMRPYQE